jgi:hypothetical protein
MVGVPTIQGLLNPEPSGKHTVETSISPDLTATKTPKPSPTESLNTDYSQLENLLKEKRWKEANEKTRNIMLKDAGREKENWLSATDVNSFSCPALQKIDQLWGKYSQSRFGFSVQKDIWLEVSGKTDWETERKLGLRLGWRDKNGKWLTDYTFNTQAPLGHLPVMLGLLGKGGVDDYTSPLSLRFDECSTEVNADYSQLENLLKEKKWKEANHETEALMLKVAGRDREGWLSDPDIKNFSCPDLKKIDQLWVKNSQGRFGFSVQKRIWLEVGGKTDWGTELKLGDRLGWLKNGEPSSNSQLTDSIQAEEGHLPWVHFDGFISFDLLGTCEL